jgi:hypothetical protein
MPVLIHTREQALASRDVLRSHQVYTHIRLGQEFECPPPGPGSLFWARALAEPAEPCPSPNHRLVAVFHAKEVQISSHWVEVRNDRLVLDIPEVNEFNIEMMEMAISKLRKENRCVSFAFGNGAQAPHSVVTPRHRSYGISGCSSPLLSHHCLAVC